MKKHNTTYVREAEALDAAALAKLANEERNRANAVVGVCENCKQYLRGDSRYCFNRCRSRGFASN